MVSGYSWDHSLDWYHKQWIKWTKPFEENELYYMYAIGNHDPEADLNNTQITNLDITHPFSLTLKSTENL